MGELEKLYEKHRAWCEIVESFGCNPETAEDIVQEMYIKIARLLDKGTDISYGNDLNYFYIFRTLTSLFIDLKRKEAKTLFINIDDMQNDLEGDGNIDYDSQYDKIKDALNELHWYNKKVYELVESGKSIAELSRDTNISYYSLYNTYKIVKQHLKDKL
jgi:DNA-directed RNA polymerase specialized sigma24 family protein